MDDDIDDDCDGVTGDNNDDNNDNATDDDINNNGNGATDDYIDDDDGDRSMDDDVSDNGYGATDGRHRLDACGGCVMKGDARRRHAATDDTTTIQQTRCKWEERRQRTRGRERERGCVM